jgi:hypothetical protein
MSKASVLIIATRYDAGSYYTYQWALDLQKDLATMEHTCLFLDAGDLCRSGASLTEAIDCVEYVVFYGHGLKDEWTALPTGSSGATTPLINTASVKILDGRRVYAGCCYSLAQLGAAYGAAFPNGEYVGYHSQFAFETANHQFFREVVNGSVIGFVKGASRKDVVAGLDKAWAALRDAFAGGGILEHRQNAFAASQYAGDNRKRIGYAP